MESLSIGAFISTLKIVAKKLQIFTGKYCLSCIVAFLLRWKNWLTPSFNAYALILILRFAVTRKI